MFSPARSKWRVVAMLMAVSVGAAACGSTESATPALSSQAPSADGAASGGNLFPDTDVLNIADGSAVNLAAELGGGDKATLLWFFAPH